MRFLSCCLAVLSLSTASAQAPTPSKDTHAEVRGITVSCQTWGWEWGSDDMLPALDRIAAQGGNWVAIHPYARIQQDGTVSSRLADTPPRWLVRPLAEARRRKLKVLIKPHLAYWGSGFSWRGAITFKTPAAWKRFFTSYEAWIVKVARLTKGGDAFAVGTELEGTTQHAPEWRKLIAAVRKETQAPLTYAANWDKYQSVPFWKSLDVIGVQAYFPLVQHDRAPTAKELASGWKGVLKSVAAYGKQQGKKVVFTELGYDKTALAAQRPWESARQHRQHRGRADAEAIQTRCLKAALSAVAAEPQVVGSFLWKMFPGQRRRREDFTIDKPAMRAVIESVWKAKPKQRSKKKNPQDD